MIPAPPQAKPISPPPRKAADMSLACRATLAFLAMCAAGCCCNPCCSPCCNYPYYGCYQPCGYWGGYAPCCGPAYPMGCPSCGMPLGQCPGCGANYGQQLYSSTYESTVSSGAAQAAVTASPGDVNAGSGIRLVSMQQPQPTGGQPSSNQSIDLSEFERQKFELLQRQLNCQQQEISQICQRIGLIDRRTAWLP